MARVLITGGARGIGAAIAERSRRDGYEPVIIDKLPTPDGYATDLTDRDALGETLERILADGPVTRLVHNAGAVFPASAEKQTLEDFEHAMALNLNVAVQCLQALLPGMRDAGFGRVVSMSSRAALGKEHRSAYAASKAGLIGLMRVWALELGHYGITANAVGPGPIATELFTNANPPESPRTKAIIAGVPMQRMGTPEDVANAVSFFLDDASGFVTGQTLYVCGGLTVGSVGV